MTIKITKHHIGGELISILTRGMYPDSRDTLREYVQNGVDAEAKNIEIKIRGDSIVVEDDGHGMDEQTMLKAIRVGISDKNPKVDVGFRGIGIYSSFHLCDQLHIYSKDKKDTPHLLIFNFKTMRDVLNQQQIARLKGDLTGDELVDLQSLLEKHIEFKAIGADKFPKESGTRIEMVNIDPSFFKSLSKFEEVADYLRQVVPLHFDPERFKWAKQIENEITEICKEHKAEFNLIDLTLQVDAKIEKLYRPYANDLFDEVSLKPRFKAVKNKNYFFGVAWGCLNETRNKINDKELRGFLIRKQGFAIGKRNDVAKYFGRTTYFDRYVGEIIIVRPDLLPNAARTDFEISPLRALFYEALSEVATFYNNIANEYQEFTKGDEELDKAVSALKELEANISFQSENLEQLIDAILLVRDFREQIKGRLKRRVLREERIKEAENIVKSAEALEKEIQNFINKTRKGVKVREEKPPEIKSLERIKKLPEVKPRKEGRMPENLPDLFDALGLSVSEDAKKALEIIDEKFIQAVAGNRAEYLLIIKNLKEEIEAIINGE